MPSGIFPAGLGQKQESPAIGATGYYLATPLTTKRVSVLQAAESLLQDDDGGGSHERVRRLGPAGGRLVLADLAASSSTSVTGSNGGVFVIHRNGSYLSVLDEEDASVRILSGLSRLSCAGVQVEQVR
eukprot:g2196.t1